MADEKFPATLEERLAELAEARGQLLALLEESDSKTVWPKTASGGWSIAEVAYHLYLSERSIVKRLTMALGASDRHGPKSQQELLQEWGRVRAVVGNRQLRAEAPAWVLPLDAPGLPETINLLNRSRQELQALLRGVSLDDLISVSASHPFPSIDTLTGAGWLSLIARHERRHTEQIREILGPTG